MIDIGYFRYDFRPFELIDTIKSVIFNKNNRAFQYFGYEYFYQRIGQQIVYTFIVIDCVAYIRRLYFFHDTKIEQIFMFKLSPPIDNKNFLYVAAYPFILPPPLMSEQRTFYCVVYYRDFLTQQITTLTFRTVDRQIIQTNLIVYDYL